MADVFSQIYIQTVFAVKNRSGDRWDGVRIVRVDGGGGGVGGGALKKGEGQSKRVAL